MMGASSHRRFATPIETEKNFCVQTKPGSYTTVSNRIRTFIVVSITIVEGDLHIPAITLPSHPIEIISAYDFIVLFQKTDLGIKVLWSATPELSVEE